MKEIGILLNPETSDLDIQVLNDKDGKIIQGLHLGNVTAQNAGLILYMNPGELKEYPTVGVGINNILLDHDTLQYKHKIRQQFGADGIQVNYLEIKDQNISIYGNYK